MVAHWYDKHARQYDSWYETKQGRAENVAIAEALNRERVQHVVDVGCGTGLGYELLEFPTLSESWYIGVDPSEGMLAEARFKHPLAQVHEPQQHPIWRQGDGAEMLRRIKNVDLVCCLFAFQYVRDPERLLMAARHALRPGGRLVVVSARRRKDPAIEVVANYRARDWRYLLRAWEDVTIRPLTPYPRLARLGLVRLPAPDDMGQYLLVEARKGGESEADDGEDHGLEDSLAVTGQETAQETR